MPSNDPVYPIWAEDDLRRAIQAAGVALWCWNIDTDQLVMDEQAFSLWAIPQSDEVTFERLSEHIHPADRDRVRAAFVGTRGIVGAYEIDFRIMVGEEIRWISARGLGNDSGLYERQMFGVFLNVTGRKQAEEGHELLAGEMSHRVKNLLAVASALTHITFRSTTTAAEMAKEMTERLAALGRAHDLVRPLPGRQGRAALLGDLLAVLLSPYEAKGAFSGRIRVAVPRMGVGESAATTLALTIHELATNSLKYGALSVDQGSLDLAASLDDSEITIVWTERGGPTVSAPEGMNGYGSKLLRRSIVGQLGGSLVYDWSPEGLIVVLKAPVTRLAV